MADKAQRNIGRGGRFVLLFTSFLSGYAILGLELLGFRIFAPTFGYSMYVSASIVGSVLFVMSLGYVIGGAIADKYPRPSAMYKIILLAGIYLIPMLLVYRKVMDACFLNMGTIAGSIFAALVIYAVPMILLSMVSPYIIRLLASQGRVGRTAGQVFFVSTIGSLAGTFITPLVLVPLLGSHTTFAIISGLVLAIGILGMLPFNFLFLFTGVLFGLIPLSYSRGTQYLDYIEYESGRIYVEKLVYETESLYNNLRVIQHDILENGNVTDREYRISVNWWTSYSVSVSPERGYLTGSYYDYFAVVPMLTEGKDILILGMGAGTSVKQFEHFYPTAKIDAVEIDPEIVRIAAVDEWFGVHDTGRVTIHTMDARPFLELTDKTFDVVELDMFQGGPNIPFYVTTVEFYEMIKEHLNPGGVVTMNVLDLEGASRLASSVGKTLQQVFSRVYSARRRGNTVLVAFKTDTSLDVIEGRIEKGAKEHPGLSDIASGLKLGQFTGSYGAKVFTDDKANIEALTFEVVEKGMKERKKGEAERLKRLKDNKDKLEALE